MPRRAFILEDFIVRTGLEGAGASDEGRVPNCNPRLELDMLVKRSIKVSPRRSFAAVVAGTHVKEPELQEPELQDPEDEKDDASWTIVNRSRKRCAAGADPKPGFFGKLAQRVKTALTPAKKDESRRKDKPPTVPAPPLRHSTRSRTAPERLGISTSTGPPTSQGPTRRVPDPVSSSPTTTMSSPPTSPARTLPVRVVALQSRRVTDSSSTVRSPRRVRFSLASRDIFGGEKEPQESSVRRSSRTSTAPIHLLDITSRATTTTPDPRPSLQYASARDAFFAAKALHEELMQEERREQLLRSVADKEQAQGAVKKAVRGVKTLATSLRDLFTSKEDVKAPEPTVTRKVLRTAAQVPRTVKFLEVEPEEPVEEEDLETALEMEATDMSLTDGEGSLEKTALCSRESAESLLKSSGDQDLTLMVVEPAVAAAQTLLDGPVVDVEPSAAEVFVTARSAHSSPSTVSFHPLQNEVVPRPTGNRYSMTVCLKWGSPSL